MHTQHLVEGPIPEGQAGAVAQGAVKGFDYWPGRRVDINAKETNAPLSASRARASPKPQAMWRVRDPTAFSASPSRRSFFR